MKLISYDELAAAPWKNGGGVTREVACYPAGATMNDFIWRVSIADVGQSGPFSNFPGIDRVITLLTGDGMRLQFSDGAQHDLVDKLAPYSFRGEDSVHARLLGTRSRDFNLMLRRNAARGTIEVHHSSSVIDRHQSTLLLFCAAGCWQVCAADVQNLREGDTIVIEGSAADTKITSLDADSALLCVRITLTPTLR